MDERIAHVVNTFAASHPLTRALAVFSAKYLIIILFLVTAAVAFRKRTVALFALAVGLSFLLNYVISLVVFRPRPQGTGVIRLITQPWSLKSFPSDHAAIAIACAWVLGWSLPSLRWPAFAVALLVAVGRVAVGVHYPLDIVGGILVGSIAATLGRWIIERS